MFHPVRNCTASAGYFVSLQGGGGDAVASLTADNAADGKTGGGESAIAGRMERQCGQQALKMEIRA